MRNQPPLSSEPTMPRQIAEQTPIDIQRLTYYRLIQAARQQQKPEEKMKKVINPNIFREEIRQQQRDFHQQNHQFLKMSGIVARSSRDDNKFNYIGDNYRKTNNFTKGNNNSKNVQKKTAAVHLSLDTVQFSCSIVSAKVPIRDLYQLFPFRKDSIIFQAHDMLSPDYLFFLYENSNDVAQSLRIKLGAIEEGLSTQFKNSISRTFKHVGFFDYLYFLNRRPKPDKDINYPSYIIEIAHQNSGYLIKIDEDQKDKFNKDEISVFEQDTCERLIIGEEIDVGDNGENLCFDTIEEYTEYKKLKAMEFKNQKIFQKDAIVNTNIRNIISTQKIYLVEIIEQVKSYILLSQECEGTTIMGKVYQHLTAKADQYMRLLCGYTESKILTIYNIENYQEKIYTFIERSVRYGKEIRNLSQAIIKQFPVLEIWYKLPQNLLGYSRQELHETFYQLIEAIIVFEKKMKSKDLYEGLKVKRPGIKYII